ncbi:MAG: hypothetical protein HON31_00150, partial [Chloroflexi bacterium]|nr:hypothetical protein [Chloroflexota bacterium]
MASVIALSVVISVGLLTGSALGSMIIGTALTGSSIGIHVFLSNRIRIVSKELAEAEAKLLKEASSSRILSGIRTLRANDSLSADARLAAAARMAT